MHGLRRGFLCCAWLSLGACQAVLGIEHVSPAPATGGAAAPAAAGTAEQPVAGAAVSGTTSDAGNHPADAAQAMSMSDAGDAKSDGGLPANEAGADAATPKDASNEAGNDASSDAGTDASSDASSDANTMDTGTPSTGSVHGKVIDFRKRAVPGTSVRIGQTSVTTNAQGEFDVSDVGANYDVALSLSVTHNGVAKKTAWLFEGLTRRDPTLQVYDGLIPRTSNCMVHLTNVDFSAAPNQVAMFAFGGPDGVFVDTLNDNDSSLYCTWEGPTTTQGTAHCLRLERDSSTDLVTKYWAYATQPLALSVSMPSDVTLNLGGSAPANATVSGGTTGPGVNSRTNFIDLHFTDGAVIDLAIDDNPSDNFSYLVPNISGATVSVLSAEGQLYPVEHETLPFMLARVDSPAAGQNGLQITIPSALAPSAPADNSSLAADTHFTWSGGAALSLLVAELGDFTFYVLTAQKKAQLPVAPSSTLGLPPATAGTWHIETHGTFQSVDAAANSDGFLDEDALFMRGPHRGPGSFTLSEKRKLTTAP